MPSRPPVVVTGQQIGAGWTPALSVVKALAALAAAKQMGFEAVYWMADEDHDRLEVAKSVGEQNGRLVHHRFHFDAPEGTATGWLPWGEVQQQEAEGIWGQVPKPATPTLRGHVLALGAPLWDRGIRPFSPTDPAVRAPIQEELERWRAMDLEAHLVRQAEALVAAGESLPLDPRQQAAWFALDPQSGLRRRLEADESCPKGSWLSPGAALRPLMQSRMLNVAAAVLGPAERAYWRLTEPLWEVVGLEAPKIIPRPTVFVAPKGFELSPLALATIREGNWEALGDAVPLPSSGLQSPRMNPVWGQALSKRIMDEWQRFEYRMRRLDRRWRRDQLTRTLGMDPERLRERLFPLGKAQERVLPGVFWLRDEALLSRIAKAMDGALERQDEILWVEES